MRAAIGQQTDLMNRRGGAVFRGAGMTPFPRIAPGADFLLAIGWDPTSPTGKAAQFPAGLTLDFITDPLSWIPGVGLVAGAVRMTNPCEQSFVEQRRRAKDIPRFRGEKERPGRMFATLWRASERRKNVNFTRVELREPQNYIKARRADRFEVRCIIPAARPRTPNSGCELDFPVERQAGRALIGGSR